MRRLAALITAAVLAGCAGGGQPPVVPPPPEIESPAARIDARCERIAALAAGGEHKPATEEMAAVRDAGLSCPPAVETAAAESRRRLEEADALLLAGRERRAAGELAAARDAMRGALSVYPDYHWATKLLGDVEEELEERLSSLKAQAAERQQAGDLGGALELLEEAARLEPESAELASGLRSHQRRVVERSLDGARAAEERRELDEAARLALRALDIRPAEPDLRLRVLEYAERLGLALFSDGALARAKEVWQRALDLDQANPKLLDYLDQVQQRLDKLEQIRTPRR